MPIARDESAILAFLQAAEGPSLTVRPVGETSRRSHAEKFFSSSDWRSLTGGGSNWTRGGFEGGKFDRNTEDWNPGNIGPNSLYRQGARVMRERARDLVINNPYAASAVDAYVANVIGQGITPKAQMEDELLRYAWDRQWQIWGGLDPYACSECDVTGHDSIYGLQALWLHEVIEAGGCLLHFVEVPRERRNRRSLPLALELIPEERFAGSMDNFAMPGRTNGKTANPIVNGVELDPATGKPVAYWILPCQPNDGAHGDQTPERIPAEDCVYAFFKQRIGQHRGWSMLHAAITWLWNLGYYTSSEMFASNMKANWAYMVLSDDDDTSYSAAEDGDVDYTADAFGNRLDKLTPGMIWRGRKGDDIKAVGPNVPQSDSLPWIQLIERSIAAAVRMSCSEMTRDYSQNNFSNTRAARSADRKRWRPMQNFCIQKFANPVWKRFVEICVRMGIDGFPSPSAYLSAPEEYLEVKQRTPGWDSVNPLDDARAAQIEVQLGTKTREQLCGEQGNDWEANLEQLARERQKMLDLGLDPVVDSAAATAAPGQGAQSGQEPPDGPNAPEDSGEDGSEGEIPDGPDAEPISQPARKARR